jgi:pimeloyl-ACP methyl ester carboxylesterase
MRPVAVTLAALAVLLTVCAGTAEARLRWRPCPEGPRCTRLAVPLDRAGTLPGTVSLRVARVARAKRPRGALMYLSGGPGGAGVAEMESVVEDMPGLARRYTVYGFDQRGTGRSGLLRCPAVERDVRLRSTAAGAQCARRLGPGRGYYTTADSVADLEAIRAALGLRRMTLFGISYGTLLALAYARAHPDRVERMVLASVDDPDDADPFGLAGFRAMPATLRALCPARCRGVTADPAADLSALTAKLRAAPLRGTVFDGRGRAHHRNLRPTAIADLVYDADYNPAMRAALPAAVRAALDHDDAAPLLRLLAHADSLAGSGDPGEFSSARYATVCEETPLPWPRGTPVGDRSRVAEQAALALPAGSFFPFDARVAFADEIDLCLRWPDPVQPTPAVPGAPYPAVPALLVQGGEDLRTPPETSARLAAALPGSKRIVVPGVGHAPTAADFSGCAARRVLLWLDGRPVGDRCPRVPTGVPATGVPPSAVGQLTPAAGVRGLRRARTVSAVGATLDDLALSLSAAYDFPSRGSGLRGGRFGERNDRLWLDGLVVVPGVRVSGRDTRAGVQLRIGGPAAAHGRLTVQRGGLVTGRLGGGRVRARLGQLPAQPVIARVARVPLRPR